MSVKGAPRGTGRKEQEALGSPPATRVQRKVDIGLRIYRRTDLAGPLFS